MIHVIPCDDTVHQPDSQCPCRPRWQVVKRGHYWRYGYVHQDRTANLATVSHPLAMDAGRAD